MSTHQVEQERNRFARALQSALTRDEVAQTYLSSVAGVIRAGGLGLYELDAEHGAVVNVRATVTGDLLDSYEAFGRADDPVLRFVAEQLRPVDSSRVTSPQKWDACGAREALGQGGFARSLEAPVMVSGLMLGTINFARTVAEPAFTEVDLMSARLVSEQLGLATERALRFELTGHRVSVLEHALDRLPQAVVVTDLDANVIFQNRVARNDFDLSVDGDSVPNELGACIEEAVAELGTAGKRVSIRSVHDLASGKKSIVKSYRMSDSDRTAITVVFPCAEQGSVRQLPTWDVLTRREQEIAQLVSEGLTTKQIAARAFISENTVKQHLKRVFAKTDVSNRAALVQLIWTANHSSA